MSVLENEKHTHVDEWSDDRIRIVCERCSICVVNKVVDEMKEDLN